ncbi:MAG: SLBB domain-containing protein [Armatimonadetes bacterium]|nr:SLBB domain-containing protein [Armatimonadota bacterium]
MAVKPNRAIWLAGCALFMSAASLHAQVLPKSGAPLPPAVPAAGAASSPAPSPVEAKPAPVVSSSYKVGSDDVLSVRVARHPEWDTVAVVLEDGSITLPRVGRMVVEGKSVLEIQGMIQNAYTKILRQPEVSVAVQTPRTRLVYVFGEVNKPGPVEYKEGVFRVTEALGRAGGPKLNPNRLTLTLTRREGGVQNLSPLAITASADSPENVEVRPGDVLVVGEIPPQPVFVAGAVVKPGMYDLRDIDPTLGAIGVTEALALSGGPAPQAALTRAFILRADRPANGEAPAARTSARRQEKVNLSEMQRNLTTAAADKGEILLYPGDTLHIPENKAKFAVSGHVLKPDTFTLPDDRPITLADAISMAGGPRDRSQLKEVNIVRQAETAQGTKPVIIKADYAALVKRGDMSQNVELKAGDVVYIPETRKADFFGKVLPGLASLSSLLYMGGLTR